MMSPGEGARSWSHLLVAADFGASSRMHPRKTRLWRWVQFIRSLVSTGGHVLFIFWSPQLAYTPPLKLLTLRCWVNFILIFKDVPLQGTETEWEAIKNLRVGYEPMCLGGKLGIFTDLGRRGVIGTRTLGMGEGCRPVLSLQVQPFTAGLCVASLFLTTVRPLPWGRPNAQRPQIPPPSLWLQKYNCNCKVPEKDSERPGLGLMPTWLAPLGLCALFGQGREFIPSLSEK